MKQSQFESLHQPQWDAYRQGLDLLERGKASAEHARSFPRDYRRLCQHLALAQERGYSTCLIDPLQQLALRGHQLLYRHRSSVRPQLLAFVLADFPRLVRESWPFILVAGLLFFGSLLGIALLVYLFPDLIYSLLPVEQVGEMQSMYDPAAGHLGHSGDVFLRLGLVGGDGKAADSQRALRQGVNLAVHTFKRCLNENAAEQAGAVAE